MTEETGQGPIQGNPGTIEADLAPIYDALEAAFVMARRDRRDPAAPPPPRALRPFIEFASLPERALVVVRDAVEADDAFRERVWDSVDPEALDPGARLFLERPDGWVEGLAALVGEQVRHDRLHELEENLDAARHDVRILSEERDDLRSRLDEISSEVAQLRDRASRHDTVKSSLEDSLLEARSALEGARDDRAEAIRQLKSQESLAVRRLAAQKSLESELAAANERLEYSGVAGRGEGGADDSGGDGADPAAGAAGAADDEAVVSAVLSFAGKAGALVAELSGELASLVEGLGEPDSGTAHGDRRAVGAPGETGETGATGGQGSPETAMEPRPRRAVRLGRGLSTDSAEGLAALLDLRDVLVMVDGYNVTMKGWSHLGISQQRESLIRSVTSLQRRHGGNWHLVFDGSEAGQRPSVSAPLGVRVHFTPANLEADDRLLEFVEQAHIDVPIVVVSSDNRVRDGARSRGANVVSSESLLSLMHISH